MHADAPSRTVASLHREVDRLREDLARARRRLADAEVRSSSLLAAAQALSSSLDPQAVFEAILAQLRLVVPYDSASVQSRRGTELTIIGVHGFPNPDEILGLTFDTDATDNPNREVVTTPRTLILPDASAVYPEFRRGPHGPASIRGWMGVPLVFGDRVLGMLAIDSRQLAFYGDHHARDAEAFAAQAAIALQNARMFERMRWLAEHDALTGLPNRRHLDEVGARAVDDALAGGLPASVVLLDLDHFKQVNDTRGHATGDHVLRQVARRVRDAAPEGSLAARLGGEELVVVLPGVAADEAWDAAEALRAAVARPIDTADGQLAVTASVGVATATGPTSLSRLMARADDALYDAKARGRDRTVAAPRA